MSTHQPIYLKYFKSFRILIRFLMVEGILQVHLLVVKHFKVFLFHIRTHLLHKRFFHHLTSSWQKREHQLQTPNITHMWLQLAATTHCLFNCNSTSMKLLATSTIQILVTKYFLMVQWHFSMPKFKSIIETIH
jgi:hypothetical protein